MSYYIDEMNATYAIYAMSCLNYVWLIFTCNLTSVAVRTSKKTTVVTNRTQGHIPRWCVVHTRLLQTYTHTNK